MITTHGMSYSPEYVAWANMTGRCENSRHQGYADYGGRGIRVFSEWLGRGGFSRFYRHIGKRPSAKHQIDRIDNDLGYFPGNVRWAMPSEQMRNTRANHFVDIGGKRLTVTDWAKEKDINYTTICHRISRGMSPEAAITAPPRLGGRRIKRHGVLKSLP